MTEETIEQERATDVEHDVEQAIAGLVQFTDDVVQHERQADDGTTGGEASRRVDEGSYQRPLAPHDLIFDDAIIIVEDKRVCESREVDEPREDEQTGEQPLFDRCASRGFVARRPR